MDSDARCAVFGLIAFVSGLAVGVATGLLLAPQSGSRTRRHLRTMVGDLGEQAGEWIAEARDRVDEMVDRGKKFVG